jgi:MFS family permease
MLYGSQPVLWSIPGDIVPRHLAGAVSGVMNGVGVLGAFIGPFVVGYVRTLTSSFSAGLGVLGACLMVAGILLIMIREAGPVRRTGPLSERAAAARLRERRVAGRLSACRAPAHCR